MQGNERWRPLIGPSSHPSARLRSARSMPPWLQARGSAIPPPPIPTNDPPLDPDYEVIEFPGQNTYSNTTPQRTVIASKGRGEGKRCDLCGSSAPVVHCQQCSSQNFCLSCDDMYHRHPKRQTHIRKPLDLRHQTQRPPLPPKGEATPAPVPPPRRNKRMTPSPAPSPHEQRMAEPKKDLGFVSSLKRVMGGRPLPPTPVQDPHMFPPRVMEFRDHFPTQQLVGGPAQGQPEWTMQRNQRAGSLTAVNHPGFPPMIQTHSMAQLNCPSCQHGVMWGDWNHPHPPMGVMNPWGGMPPANAWHSSAALNYRPPEQDGFGRRNSLRRRAKGSSGSEDEVMSTRGTRRRRASPAMSLRSKNADTDYDSDIEDEEPNLRNKPSSGRSMSPLSSRRIPRRASMADGLNRVRRNDDDTLSSRGGRRFSQETMSSRGRFLDDDRRGFDFDDARSIRGGRRSEFNDTMSLRGGRRGDIVDTVALQGMIPDYNDSRSVRGARRSELDDTRSLRGGKKTDFDTLSSRSSRRYEEESVAIGNGRKLDMVDPAKVRLDDEIQSNRGGRKTSKEETLSRKESATLPTSSRASKRNERFSDTGRRRRSPVNYRNEEALNHTSDRSDEGGTLSSKTNSTDHIEINGEKSPRETPVQEEEEEENTLGPIPQSEWECEHCTFVNEGGTRVCAVCCKTSSRPKVLTEQSKMSESMKKMTVSKPIQPISKQSPPMSKPTSPMPKSASPLSKSTSYIHQAASPPQEKKKGQQNMIDHKVLMSTGTSPPPQSISTQTYGVITESKPNRIVPVVENEWIPPQRSYSRQSLSSDTQSLPITPARSRSPESFATSEGPLESNVRRSSEPISQLQRNGRRAGSQPPDYISTLVQKQVKQGLEMVKLLREAEEHQFSADDLAVALTHCSDGDPITWLLENWRNMIDTVVTLATNYGHERKENTIGTISASEARDALRKHDGNVWAAVTECVEQRQRKYAELLSRGNFSREDIVTVLTANHGNLEAAYTELNKSQLKPFLMRIWGPPQGTDNDSGNPSNQHKD